MAAVLKAVAEAPPNAFAGGGYWEAMHGSMAGYYEVRVDGRATGATTASSASSSVTEHDLASCGPSVIVITGMEKPFRTKLSERDYARVRQLGEEYRSRVPRSVLG
jgi:hypothetical protein